MGPAVRTGVGEMVAAGGSFGAEDEAAAGGSSGGFGSGWEESVSSVVFEAEVSVSSDIFYAFLVLRGVQTSSEDALFAGRGGGGCVRG